MSIAYASAKRYARWNMNYKDDERARLLNDAHSILFTTRHKLGWVNFYTPDIKSLELVREELERAIAHLTSVIDDKLFPSTPKLTLLKPPIPSKGLS